MTTIVQLFRTDSIKLLPCSGQCPVACPHVSHIRGYHSLGYGSHFLVLSLGASLLSMNHAGYQIRNAIVLLS